ncbi:F0F1-ATPase subunit, putative [Synechococcus sp. PCC 7335]|uniref:AtpZ/AtpI family protein n=1 Tax=Synechococcus sp. (strain ATCC 29403 / PCC 7335) TaxID=91464 RepID=UPI00017ED657|nr:AtpZ/AtpI family protein [Synechococcus sp. PCC 7335]EDX82950.1 F0F1-ATPase subunit, putative [Synechococcus sp. PCC 7335]
MKPEHPHRQRQKEDFLKKISRKSQRKLKAQRSRSQAWIGMRMFGLVGWAVSIPTLIGIALGVWIDRQVQSQYSWTLMLLIVGIALGCFNGWYWIEKESKGD